MAALCHRFVMFPVFSFLLQRSQQELGTPRPPPSGSSARPVVSVLGAALRGDHDGLS